MRQMGLVLLASALAGCATQFWGSAKVSDGPKGCKAVCDAWGMELAGMVQMGNYSDGCICQVKPKGPPPGQAPAGEAPAAGPPSAAVIPAATGVYLQMQAAAAGAAAQQNATQRQSPGTSWHPTHSPGVAR